MTRNTGAKREPLSGWNSGEGFFALESNGDAGKGEFCGGDVRLVEIDARLAGIIRDLWE